MSLLKTLHDSGDFFIAVCYASVEKGREYNMDTTRDYSLIILTNEEQILFDRFKRSDSVCLTKDEFEVLRNRGLVKGLLGGKSDFFDLPSSGICEISELGKRLRVYQTRSKKQHVWTEFRAWATLAIALIALIVSIASLLLQLR